MDPGRRRVTKRFSSPRRRKRDFLPRVHSRIIAAPREQTNGLCPRGWCARADFARRERTCPAVELSARRGGMMLTAGLSVSCIVEQVPRGVTRLFFKLRRWIFNEVVAFRGSGGVLLWAWETWLGVVQESTSRGLVFLVGKIDEGKIDSRVFRQTYTEWLGNSIYTNL